MNLSARVRSPFGAVLAKGFWFAASLLVRRRLPVVPLLAGVAVIELDNTEVKGLAEAGIFLVGFIVALYSAGRWAQGWTFAASCTFALAAIPLAAIEPGQSVGSAMLRSSSSSSVRRSSPGACSAVAASGSGCWSTSTRRERQRRSQTNVHGLRATCTTSSRTQSV
jgi:hypothetical protein